MARTSLRKWEKWLIMRRKNKPFILRLCIFLSIILIFTGCTANDPNKDSWYQKGPLYVWNTDNSTWVQVTGNTTS